MQDAHPDHIAHRKSLSVLNKDGTIDIRRLVGAATISQIVLVKALHQHIQLCVLALLVDFLGNTGLQGHQLVIAIFLHFGSNLVFHGTGHSALLLGILENTCIFKALLFYEIHKLRKILVCFTGEAHDEGGADGDAGDAGAQLVE